MWESQIGLRHCIRESELAKSTRHHCRFLVKTEICSKNHRDSKNEEPILTVLRSIWKARKECCFRETFISMTHVVYDSNSNLFFGMCSQISQGMAAHQSSLWRTATIVESGVTMINETDSLLVPIGRSTNQRIALPWAFWSFDWLPIDVYWLMRLLRRLIFFFFFFFFGFFLGAITMILSLFSFPNTHPPLLVWVERADVKCKMGGCVILRGFTCFSDPMMGISNRELCGILVIWFYLKLSMFH